MIIPNNIRIIEIISENRGLRAVEKVSKALVLGKIILHINPNFCALWDWH